MKAASSRALRRVWIDLANSPHPVLFEPIVEELEHGGHEVVISARDHAQTLALARQRWSDVHVVGGGSPGGPAAKLRVVLARASALARFARDREIDVAVSHNSYAQTVAARLVGLPCVTAMDYEYQPANHVAFRFANRILVPDDFPSRMLRVEGGTKAKAWRYRGFKEEVYLHRFEPDPSVLSQLGLEEGEPFFVARPSPQGATYHQFENPLFDRAIGWLLDHDWGKVVFLPRRPEDLTPFAHAPPDRRIVPPGPVDTRSLVYYATAMLGAGGTMNREAALLGTFVVSLYAGRLAALDQRLVREGRLRVITEDFDEVRAKLEGLASQPGTHAPPRLTSHVLDRFIEAIVTPFRRGARATLR
jgi:predicted glycosyltransferase